MTPGAKLEIDIKGHPSGWPFSLGGRGPDRDWGLGIGDWGLGIGDEGGRMKGDGCGSGLAIRPRLVGPLRERLRPLPSIRVPSVFDPWLSRRIGWPGTLFCDPPATYGFAKSACDYAKSVKKLIDRVERRGILIAIGAIGHFVPRGLCSREKGGAA
jgi:hypothetical protein